MIREPWLLTGNAREVGTHSDVYSLGAILYERLTGRPPFKGPTIWETLRMTETEPVPPMPGVPAALEAVCRRALAKDPAGRFPSMEAFAAARAAFADQYRRVVAAPEAGTPHAVAQPDLTVKNCA